MEAAQRPIESESTHQDLLCAHCLSWGLGRRFSALLRPCFKLGSRGRGRQVDAPTAAPPTLIGIRDRALIGVMVYSFARVGTAVAMRVGDFFQHRKRLWLNEKGGKRHEVPCHPSLE